MGTDGWVGVGPCGRFVCSFKAKAAMRLRNPLDFMKSHTLIDCYSCKDRWSRKSSTS